MGEKIKCTECNGTGMRERMSRFLVVFTTFTITTFLSFLVFGTMFGSSEIGLEAISDATSVCANNNGISVIHVDYEYVVCANSARFAIAVTD